MSRADRAGALRSAATWLLWATIVIVVDLRIGGSSDGVGVTGGVGDVAGQGVDVINDVVGAALVVPGVLRLREAVDALPDARPWVGLAWAAALVQVPLVVAEEWVRMVGIGATELELLQLLSSITGIGGTFVAARAFAAALRSLGDPDGLAERWDRTGWWVVVAGGLPALFTTLGPLVGLVDPGDRGDLVGLFAGAAVLAVVALVLGLIALIALLTALNRTRTLTDPAPAPA